MSNSDEDKPHLNTDGTVEMPAKYKGKNKFEKYSYLQNIIEKETDGELKKALAMMRDKLWTDPSFHIGTPMKEPAPAWTGPDNPGGRQGGGKRRKKSKRRKSKRRNSKKRRSKKRRSKRRS